MTAITLIFPDVSFDEIYFILLFFADPIKGHHATLIAKSAVPGATNRD